MASVDDPRGDRNRFEHELELLEDIDQETATAIRRWAESMTTEYSTRAGHIQRVRMLAGRSPEPLASLDEDGFYELHSQLRSGSHPDVKDSGLAESTLRAVRSSARLFFRDALDREWAEDISVGAATASPVTPDDLVTSEDITALFDAVTNARDAALLATLIATGQRISATLSLRIRDVDLTGRAGTIHLNDEALGLKGASGPRPLLWATGFVGQWLNVHPRGADPGAALFCTLKSGQGGPGEHSRRYEKGDPLSRFQAHSRLKDLAEAAGVEPVKVKPHNLRHAAITRMARDNWSEQKIKWMVGWSKDSSQFERYQHLQDEEMLDSILDDHGISKDDVDDVGRAELDACPRCDTTLRPGASFCDNCGIALDAEAHDAVDEAESKSRMSTARVDRETAVAVSELIDRVKEDPEAAVTLARELGD